MAGQRSTIYDDKVILKIFEEYEIEKKTVKENKTLSEHNITDDKIMSEVLFRNEIEDSVNLIDDRTIEILRDYQFYKFAPHKIDNPAWKEAVIILNRLTPSLF